MDVSRADAVLLDWSWKGFPMSAPPCAVRDVGQQGWHALLDLPLPIALLKADCLQRNAAFMRSFTDSRGIALAPHAKTSTSPQLCQLQMQHGAWGLTVANVRQAQMLAGMGVRRLLLANQLHDELDVQAALQLTERHPELQLFFLIDSLQQLQQIVRATAGLQQGQQQDGQPHCQRALLALVELGVSGGRAGVRSVQAGLELAKAVAASGCQRLQLAGVECYEGVLLKGQDEEAEAQAVRELLQATLELCRQCDACGLFAASSAAAIVVSAGGSAIFDVVCSQLQTALSSLRLSRPVLPVLRSGCYLTHDNGLYARFAQHMGRRLQTGVPLSAALEVWAPVQSLPEPGLCIVAMGRRDASFDQDLPVALAVLRTGDRDQARACRLQGKGGEAPSWQQQLCSAIECFDAEAATRCRLRVERLMDQHACLSFDSAQLELSVGDLLCFGVSHPCTTLEKWRWMPVVDRHYAVQRAATTSF